MDNLGREEIDTVRESSSLSNGCYVKTYSYRGLPVACTAIVELVPKVPGTDVVSGNIFGYEGMDFGREMLESGVGLVDKVVIPFIGFVIPVNVVLVGYAESFESIVQRSEVR